MAEPKLLRCAVYTRKSSEEGLEQAFNSLHAQREACEAYILSQKHEGWQLVPTTYDDGGFSGGSMNRPALQALLADVAAGRVDIVVVYKVDRLTRSLADFAKMVETFDARSASFVSVTQAFNTTTSMGRLTLNVLLSFAQFEREVTGERIRDKIAASKAKGMWMGGVVPLGYDVGDRALIVNEAEAAQVRDLFACYLDLGSADAVVGHAARHGITSKRHATMAGVHRGGGRITRGSLYRILANPLYAGLVAHGGKLHAGQHTAIVPRETWDSVQAKLAGNRRKERGTRTRTDRRHALAGRVHAADGTPLRATHTRHGTRRYDYYVGGSMRIAAAALDTMVADAIADHVAEPARLAAALLAIEPPTASHVARGKRLALALTSDEQADALRTAVERVVVDQDTLAVTLAPSALGTSSAITLTIATSIARREERLSIVVPGIRQATPDTALVRAIAQARGWFAELAAGKTPSIEAIAERDHVSPTYVSTWLPAAFIAPRIVEMIAHGEQPAWLTRQKLRTMLPLPHGWEEQHAALCGDGRDVGFSSH